MSGPEQIDPALGFANRAQDLMVNHPFLDHPTVVALAQNTTTPQQANTQANSVAQAIAQTWDGYEQTWSDPTLQAQPTTQTALAQYIHDTIGAPPIDAGTISQLQKSLQADGLGAGLATDGAWTDDWQQQYNQALQTLRQNQLAGEKPGSVKTSTGLHAFLSHLTVTGALDAITGFAKSIPGDVRDALGDAAGLVRSNNFGPVVLNVGPQGQQEFAQGRNPVVNALGAKETLPQSEAKFNPAEAVEDLNTVLSVIGLGGVAKGAVGAVGKTITERTLEKGAPELARTPGVIAKTLFNANGNGRLLGSKWVGNLPGLARVTPMVGQIAGKDGWYYGARTFLAQPYKYAAVRAAGQAFSRTQLAGLGLYADALATSKLPGNTQAQDVLNTHTFDAINHNITNYGPTVFGWSPLDVNNLMLFLHGPAGLGTEGSASNTVGRASQAFLNNFADTLGVKGLPAAFQQATGMNRDEWLQAAGGDSTFLSAFMTSKALGYVKDWWADRQLGQVLNGADKTQVERLAELKTQFSDLPKADQAKAAQDLFASDPGAAYLTTRIRGDIARGAADPKTAAAKSLAEFKTQYEQMQKIRNAGGLRFLMSPQGQAILGEEAVFHNAANLPADFGSARHMAELAPLSEGDLGLMRVDNLTRGDVLDPGGIADQFQKALDAAGDDPALRKTIADAMTDHLFENHNMDARAQGVWGATDNPERALDIVKQRAEDLAADVIPTYDMPPKIQSMIDDLRTAGYKIVVGKHLGDFYTNNLPDLGANDGWLTFWRKWAGKAGLDPARVPDQEVGRATRQGLIDEMTPVFTAAQQAGKVGKYQTAQTAMAMFAEDGGVQKSLPRLSAALFHLTAKVGGNKTEIEHLFKTGGAQSLEEARGEFERRLASGLGPRDVTRKAMDEALATTHLVQAPGGQMWEWQGIADKATRSLIIRAVQRGYRQPGYLMGWQAIENFARAGYGFGDKLATRFPNSDLAQNVANWPNRVAQVRNQLRFTLSPVFDARRWAKQSAKMIAEGVEPVTNPLQSLIDQGSDIAAQKTFQRIAGRTSDVNDQMDADRMLAGRSIFGLYSPQWHAVYFINELKKAGKTDAEIKDAYNRVFKYGSGGGTSPLERSVNTIFFPFSFEKTLLRNFGGYFLDRPAQALALDLAVDEWRKADKDGAIGKFVDDHLPILQEMQLLNAFSHGISPGQLGGINAPIIGGAAGIAEHAVGAVQNPTAADSAKSGALLNLFLPQNWGANLTRKNLQRYMPVVGQFAKLWQSTIEQGQIGINAMYDTVGHALGATTVRPTLTTLAQQQYGTRAKVDLIDKLQPVLDYNAKHADDADKIKWLPGANVPSTLIGQPINRTTIGEYVHQMYPQYDPAAGTAYAQSQARDEASFIANITQKDPAKGQLMASFAKAANSVIGKINRDQYDPSQLAQIQGAFHEAARAESKLDPDWRTLWNSYLAYALGPIQSADGKKAA